MHVSGSERGILPPGGHRQLPSWQYGGSYHELQLLHEEPVFGYFFLQVKPLRSVLLKWFSVVKKAPRIRTALTAFCIGLALCLPTFAQLANPIPWDSLSPEKIDAYSFARKNSGTNDAVAKNCLESAKALPKSGNSVVDMRCSLVAFEVCIYKGNGTISQSQDSRKQCGIIKGLAGPAACQQPCEEAASLPVGGDGVVQTPGCLYTGMTPFAVACYRDTLTKALPGNPAVCLQNDALQCLMNGSASPEVNAAIRKERHAACAQLQKDKPLNACVACFEGKPRVDYAPDKVDIDAGYCSAEMAAQRLCAMTKSQGELPN